MTKAWAAGLAICGMLAAAAPAPASDLEYFTGARLYTLCSAKPGEADYETRSLQCHAYVLGVSDAQQAAQGAGGRARVCLPPGAKPPDLVAAVTAYLETNPDKRPMAAQDLVLNALGETYACK